MAFNYENFCRVAGKYTQVYQNATAGNSTENASLVKALEQFAAQEDIAVDVATGDLASAVVAEMTKGAVAAKQAIIVSFAGYLISSTVLGYFTVAPTANAPAVLMALAALMAANADNKTFTTVSTTGLVAFFNAVNSYYQGAAITWHTAGSPDYADASYVKDAIVS